MPKPLKPEERKRPPRPGEGQPMKDIDIDVVERAASIGCTPEEIATVCKVSRTTFFERMKDTPEVAQAITRGRENGRATLRRLQWQKANAGSDTMLIWLGKQLLHQTDRMENAIVTPEALRRVAEDARLEQARRGDALADTGRPAAGTLPN